MNSFKAVCVLNGAIKVVWWLFKIYCNWDFRLITFMFKFPPTYITIFKPNFISNHLTFKGRL